MPYTLTIPLSVTSDVLIKWGDGQSTVHPASGPFSHTYDNPGNYDIEVVLTSDTHMTNFVTNGWSDRAKVIDVKQWGEGNFINGNNFRDTSLVSISAPDYPRRLVNASFFFFNCTKLEDLGNFRTDNVTTFADFMQLCTKFNGSLLNISTSNATTVVGMFSRCASLNQSLNHFDTSKVTAMQSMLRNCNKFNQLITFDTSKVTTFQNFLLGCLEFNQPLNHLDFSSATNMAQIVDGCPLFNQDCSMWITPVVTSFLACFRNSGMDTTNTDNLLIALANQPTPNNVNCNLAFRPRTTASDVAKATLVARGWYGIP